MKCSTQCPNYYYVDKNTNCMSNCPIEANKCKTCSVSEMEACSDCK